MNQKTGVSKEPQQVGDYVIGLDIPLGRGSQGQVFLGKSLITNESVAIKRFPKDNPKIGDCQIVKQLFNMEKMILKACKEKEIPNIIEFIDYLETDKNYYLVLELCDQSLFEYLKGHGPIPESQSIQWISQIVGAMKTLHELGYCHRDLKPENIVIKDDQVKIIDLSFGRHMPKFNNEHQLIQSQKGTIGYIAPEILKGLYSPFLSDVYSLGIVFYEMLFGIRNQNRQNDEIFFPNTPVINQKTKTLIESMTKIRPSQRADWHVVSSTLQELQELHIINQNNQLLVSANLFQSSIYYSEKWKKDIEFLLSIIEDSSILRIGEKECTPCVLLINKIAIDKVEKKLISLDQQENSKQGIIKKNLQEWLKTLQYQLRGPISTINKLYNDIRMEKLSIREMKEELKNELSPDYKKTFQKQVKYYFTHTQDLRSTNIQKNIQISKLQLKLLVAYDFESDFENIRTLLLAAQYEIQENIIEFLNKIFTEEKTERSLQKLNEMINTVKVIIPQ